MTDTEERWRDLREGWEHLGRAAERFARRVSDDARRFAERVEEHVGELAKDLRREWSSGTGSQGSAAELRRVFEEVRGVLSAVLQGVDELVSDLFAPPAEGRWTRTVCDRDATCAGCGRTVPAGGAAHARGRGSTREVRCLECGVPGEGSRPA